MDYKLNEDKTIKDEQKAYLEQIVNAQEERKSGLKIGILIGVISTFVLCAIIVFCLAFSGNFISFNAGKRNAINSATIKKANEIKKYIDNYYYHSYKDSEVQEYTLKGMVAGLDDIYSAYYNEKETAELLESLKGEFCGIGAMLQKSEDGKIKVVEVYEDSPAKKAGLEENDLIIKVEGEDITGLALDAAVAKIKGEKGTQVKLTILRSNKEQEIKAIRDKINIQTVKYEVKENNIGYIKITEFDSVTEEQFKAALDDLKGKSVEGLIIDLRDNPGGELSSVVNICDDFMPKGLVVYTKDKNGDKKEYCSKGDDKLDIPLVVLVNENSASAAEIMTGAIKDRGIGKIVGTKTYGKGVVQQLFGLSDRDLLKITISQYYTPKGKSINKKGIKPDFEVKVNSQNKDKEDEQLKKALEVVKDK